MSPSIPNASNPSAGESGTNHPASLSIVICTYQRVERVERLLECLVRQTTEDFEVLLVDGGGTDSDAHRYLAALVARLQGDLNIRLLASPKGLTRQRNRALAEAMGKAILFLDDDVTFKPDFVARALSLLAHPDWGDIGGFTGFDTLHHGQRFNWRWHLRAAFRIAPGLAPGRVDRWGRSIPVGFMQPFTGVSEVGYLPGHCMLFRRSAIGDLRFDETLPTYGGEDRDFSWRLGRHSRLAMCGDWQLEHHCASESRDTSVQRIYQAGFGQGRLFRQNASRFWEYLLLIQTVACEFGFDGLACLWRPTREKWRMPAARFRGFLAGVRSVPRMPRNAS